MVKLSKLKLGQKFTLMLLVVFIGGILMSGLALSRLLNYTTQAELTNKALMLMETMNSVREYTVSEVSPELEAQSEIEFLPETVFPVPIEIEPESDTVLFAPLAMAWSPSAPVEAPIAMPSSADTESWYPMAIPRSATARLP